MSNQIIQAGTSKSDFTVNDLAPNNYLTIMWNGYKGEKFKVQTLSVDVNRYNEMLDLITNSFNQTKGNVLSSLVNNKYVNLGSVAKYFAQTTFESYGARQAVNGLVNIMQDGKIQNDDVLNSLLYYSGDIINDVAKDMNIADSNLLVQQLAGQNVLNDFSPFKFLDSFCNKTQDWTDKSEAILNEKAVEYPYSEDVISKEYAGILLGITESDTHSVDIDIPRKRTESGYEYTSHVIVNPFKKDLKLRLTNKIITNDKKLDYITEVKNIEAVRDIIEQIANSKTRFDIYIRLSDRDYKCYTGLMFSSISFDKNSTTGSSYDFSCTIEPVNEYVAKTYIFTPSKSQTSIKTNNSSNNNSSRTKGGKSNSAKNNNNDIYIKSPTSYKAVTTFYERTLVNPATYGIYDARTIARASEILDEKSTYLSGLNTYLNRVKSGTFLNLTRSRASITSQAIIKSALLQAKNETKGQVCSNTKLFSPFKQGDIGNK